MGFKPTFAIFFSQDFPPPPQLLQGHHGSGKAIRNVNVHGSASEQGGQLKVLHELAASPRNLAVTFLALVHRNVLASPLLLVRAMLVPTPVLLRFTSRCASQMTTEPLGSADQPAF
jgi:hypothetical protein